MDIGDIIYDSDVISCGSCGRNGYRAFTYTCRKCRNSFSYSQCVNCGQTTGSRTCPFTSSSSCTNCSRKWVDK
ncbi:MAG: hypothetical protein HFJ23_09010 [Clostridia bacterium]|nr:hypothetical protein [Clostridia bacterium]